MNQSAGAWREGNSRHAWRWLAPLTMVCSLLDGLLSLQLHAHWGSRELNPLLAAWIDGPLAFLSIKLMLTGLAVGAAVYLWQYGWTRMIWMASLLLYVALVAYYTVILSYGSARFHSAAGDAAGRGSSASLVMRAMASSSGAMVSATRR